MVVNYYYIIILCHNMCPGNTPVLVPLANKINNHFHKATRQENNVYCPKQVIDKGSDQKSLFHYVDSLLHRKNKSSLPHTRLLKSWQKGCRHILSQKLKDPGRSVNPRHYWNSNDTDSDMFTTVFFPSY